MNTGNLGGSFNVQTQGALHQQAVELHSHNQGFKKIQTQEIRGIGRLGAEARKAPIHHMSTQGNDYEDLENDLFNDIEKRPESARQQKGRGSLNINKQAYNSQQHYNNHRSSGKVNSILDGVNPRSPVREERDSSSSKVEEEENLSQGQDELQHQEDLGLESQDHQSEFNDQATDDLARVGQNEEQIIETEEAGEEEAESVKMEQIEDDDKVSVLLDTQEMKIPFSNAAQQDPNNSVDNFEVPLPANRQSNPSERQSKLQEFKAPQAHNQSSKTANFMLETGPYMNGMSYGGLGGVVGLNNLMGQNDFDDNLLMLEDLDIDDLLECEDIEQSAFLNSSKQLLHVIDNVISCIDDRINYKRSVFYGGGSGGPNGLQNEGEYYY